MSPAQEQSVSSSVPNPLYGGTLIVSVENQKLWLDFQRSEFEIIKQFLIISPRVRQRERVKAGPATRTRLSAGKSGSDC